MHWWQITPAVTVFEVVDLVLASVGTVISMVNVVASIARLRAWVESGRDGLVAYAARVRVRHEVFRLVAQGCMVVWSGAAMTVHADGPTVLLAQVVMLMIILLTTTTSISSWHTGRVMERYDTQQADH